jgi:hypothetical protein
MSHEPVLISDPSLHEILEELKDREPIFHRPELGFTRAHFEQMTLPDFWETGASGKRYSREFVLAELGRRYANGPYKNHWEASEFHCRQLASDVYLLTYTLLQEESRKTRRLTIWQRSPDGWKVVYHQGTLALEP